MKRFVLTLLFFAVVSVAVGLLVSGNDYFDWAVAGGLFAFAVAGEVFRLWVKRSRSQRTPRRESSGI